MVTKSDSPATPPTVKDSAQQIWQAGLGAFTRAQAEGSKAFEVLVQEGVKIQRKTQAAAEERIAEATHKMTSMATEIGSKATGQWDKLENIFEDRVAKALVKLGMPSAPDVSALMQRIEALEQAVQSLQGLQRLQTKSPTSKAPSKVLAKVPTKQPTKAASKAPAKVAAKAQVKVPAKAAPRPRRKPAAKRT